MKFVFTDKKVDVPGAIHFYAEKKVGKLDRFFKEDATAAITFSVEKERLNKVEITIRAAQIAGVDDRLGSLTPGKDADIVITSGHPINLLSRVRAVFIGGKRVQD